MSIPLILFPALLTGVIIWLLPWRPWSCAEQLDPPAGVTGSEDLSDITVLIPARNEADVIGNTLAALAQQGNKLNVILVDDESTDGTAERARAAARGIHLQIINGNPLAAGWSGKLWALEQARACATTPLILLLDADIQLLPGLIATLRAKLRAQQLNMISLMAHLGMQTFTEKLLLPAFIYFFKMLYPFRLANHPQSKIAAAAGGCVLIETAWLQKIGGFTTLKGALIDDCTLAARVKGAGGKIWIGLTHSAVSLRRYPSLRVITQMVARSAYTQLRYSPLLLLLYTVLMVAIYLLPPWVMLADPLAGAAAWGALAWLLVSLPYLPTLLYYRLSPRWLLAMPLIAALYLGMTWWSAIRYYFGRRAQWKGRVYH